MIKEILLLNIIDEISMGPFGSNIKIDNFVPLGVPVLNGANVIDKKLVEKTFNFISEEKANSLGKANAKKGDIIITHRGTLGQVSFIPNDSKYDRYVISQSQFRVRFKKEINPIYITYLFHTEYGQKKLLSFKNHVGVPALAQATSNFKRLKLKMHDKINQDKIVNVLSVLDNKIELNNKVNAELDAIARTLYEYWFVQFEFPDKNGKPYKSSGGRMVWNRELKKEIPEEWNAGFLSELFAFNPPLHLKTGIVCSYIDMDALPTEGFMTKEVQKKQYKGGVKFQNWDLIIARITPCLENGKTGLITLLSTNEIGFGSTEFIVLRGKKRNLSCFASFLSRSELFRKFSIANMIGTSGRKRVDFKTLQKFPIAIPSDSLLDKFEQTVAPFFNKQTIATFENQKLSELRDWLLPMLMNGQIKVAYSHIEKGKSAEVVTTQLSANIEQVSLPIPTNKLGFAKQVLAGKIVSLFKDEPNFTDIKFQKVQFLAEHVIQANLNLNYYYQAAGPYDNKFMHTIRDNFKKNKWFDKTNKQFSPLEKQDKIDDYYQIYFRPVIGKLNTLFGKLANVTETEAEIIATLYAVWNNRIIEGKSFKNEELIRDFYQWSERKRLYSEKQIIKGFQWLRDNRMEPNGFGKVIKKAKSKSK